MATNFPSGLASQGVPLLGSGPQIPVTSGSYFFVSSTLGSSGNTGKTISSPVATLQQAINKCTAAKNDVIVVLPGHAETVTAGSIAVNKSGVQIVGLGQGALRPTFTYSTDTTITVTAANCSIKNCIFVANFADVAVGITVSGTNFILDSCAFLEAGTDLNWFTCVATSATNNAADGLTITNNYVLQEDAAAKAPWSILGNIKRLVVNDNQVYSAGTGNIGHFIITSSKVLTGAQILRNVLVVVGATDATVGIFFTGSGTSTGVIAYNLISSLDTTSEIISTTGTGLKFFENLYTGTADASGYLLPAADSAA